MAATEGELEEEESLLLLLSFLLLLLFRLLLLLQLLLEEEGPPKERARDRRPEAVLVDLFLEKMINSRAAPEHERIRLS